MQVVQLFQDLSGNLTEYGGKCQLSDAATSYFFQLPQLKASSVHRAGCEHIFLMMLLEAPGKPSLSAQQILTKLFWQLDLPVEAPGHCNAHQQDKLNSPKYVLFGLNSDTGNQRSIKQGCLVVWLISSSFSFK